MSYKFFSLSQPQQRIFLTQNIYPFSSLYNIGGSVLINGYVDTSILQQAIKMFIHENDSFQIRLVYKGHIPMQFFCMEESNVDFLDFSRINGEAEKHYRKWEARQARTPFEMMNEPLYQFAVIKISDHLYGYFVKLHHIIADGWSIQLLTKRIHENYMELKYGTIVDKESNCQYKNYLVDEQKYLASASYDKDKQYWLNLLKNVDCNSNNMDCFIDGIRTTFFLTGDVVVLVRSLCKAYNISLNIFFISIYSLYTYKKRGLKKFIIGIPVLGRKGKMQHSIFGMMVNTVPLLIQIEPSQSFIELARNINKSFYDCYKHQRYPYNHMVRGKGWQVQSLYNECMNYYGTKLDQTFDGFPVTNTEFYNGQQSYMFQMIVREWQGEEKVQLDIDAANSVYSQLQINDLISEFIELVNCFAADPTKCVNMLGRSIEEELSSKVKKGYNDTKRKLETEITIVDLFERAVKRYADCVAVECEGETFTYAQFHEKILKFCALLAERGIKSGSIIGVIATHSVDMLTAIWGILAYGCVILPIDPKTPVTRQRYLLENVSAKILFSNIPDLDIPGFGGAIYAIQDIEMARLGEINRRSNPERLAYIMYTSGSTGQPKGVQVSHKNLLNYICWAKKQYVVGNNNQEAEVFPLFTSISFDLTVTTLFTPLISGSKIIIYPEYDNECSLFRILNENRCTVVKLTPSHLSLIRDRIGLNSSIRRFIVGGEALQTSLAGNIYRNWGGKIEIINEYGPTEATVGCMSHRFDFHKDVFDSVPIGKPIWNTKIYILDKDMQEVPIGKTGEIYIAGDCVTQGYVNCPELTDKRFIFHDMEEGREQLYRTGDRAKFLDHDTMLYCGRLDSQVKIQGHRIELQEIESEILKNSAVDEVHVMALDNFSGVKQLCGYYTSVKGLRQEELRLFLQENVQQYMIPTWLIHMNNFPLSNNGKLDSDLLPKPQSGISSKDYDHSPLLDISAKILGVDGIVLDDDFYSLGGSSISAIQISSKLRENKLLLSVKSILENPVFRDMETCIERQEDTLFDQGLCSGEIEPTPIVKWFFAQPFKNLNTYYQELQLMLTRPIDIVTLEKALTAIVRYHDILRVNVREDRRLFYNNEHLKRQVKIEEIGCEERTREAFEHIIEKSKQKLLSEMNITSGLLVRSCLVSMGEVKVWCILIHHLVVDGISLRVLLDDITTSLRCLLQGQDVKLPMKTLSYKAYAEDFKKGDDRNCSKRVPAIQNAVREEQQNAILELDQETTQILLQDANRRYSTKPVELLLAGLLYTLYENVQNQWELQLEGHGRDNDKYNISRTVGWFTYLASKNINHIPDNMEELIIYAKETYRSMINTANEHSSEMFNRSRGERSIRFNYMGDFRTKYDFFIVEPVFSLQNELLETMELDMVVVNRKIMMCLRMRNSILCGVKEADDFLAKYKQNIENIVGFCCQTGERHFSPSDFGLAHISQIELDHLFV